MQLHCSEVPFVTMEGIPLLRGAKSAHIKYRQHLKEVNMILERLVKGRLVNGRLIKDGWSNTIGQADSWSNTTPTKK